MDRSRSNRRATFLPRVDALEDRLVPAVSATQAPGSDMILIVASGRRDVIRILDAGGTGAGAISVPAAGFVSSALPAGRSPVIDIFTGRGSDRVQYVSTGHRPAGAGLGTTGQRTVVVNLGTATDALRRVASRTGTTGSGERLRVLVNGGASSGGLALNFSGLAGSLAAVRLTAGQFRTGTTTTAAAQTIAPLGSICGVPTVLFSPPFGGSGLTGTGLANGTFTGSAGGPAFAGAGFLNSLFPGTFSGTAFNTDPFAIAFPQATSFPGTTGMCGNTGFPGTTLGGTTFPGTSTLPFGGNFAGTGINTGTGAFGVPGTFAGNGFNGTFPGTTG